MSAEKNIFEIRGKDGSLVAFMQPDFDTVTIAARFGAVTVDIEALNNIMEILNQRKLFYAWFGGTTKRQQEESKSMK